VTYIRALAATPRGELTLLFLASLAVVGTLVLVAAVGGELASGTRLRLMLLTCMAASLVVGAVVLLTGGAGNGETVAGRQEADELRRALATAESIVKAEPQLLIYWERGEQVRVVANTLATVPGLPEDAAEMQRFGRWLDATSADELQASLQGLFASGKAFNILVRTQAGAHLEADGRAAGGRAILRLRDVVGYRRDLARILDQHREIMREIRCSRALLDALPMPVWMRDESGRIGWANAAYMAAVQADTLEEVRLSQIELLETRQREEVRGALKSGQAYRAKLPLISGGERKAHDVVVLPLEGASAAAAIDVAAIETAQGELDRQIAAYERTLHRVATGVASFGPDRRLTFFNDAFRTVWQLDADWLATTPTDSEFLDRLRQLSRLPQVGNYREWKAKMLAVPQSGAPFEDWWHLLDGRTIHVLAEPRPDGGVTYLYDDATERLQLESRYNALIDVQRETLDSLKEGVAVFAPDGRLKLFNSALAQVWRLSRATLSEGPHIDEIIRQCSVLYDDPRTWGRMSHAVTGITDRRAPLEGQIVRPDMSVIDFSVSPLPDGATLITFADVTDAKRYERALIERNEALVAADRLKSQFISHVSYELRTPLTNIIGFSEFLTSPHTGTLNEKQQEYLGDISASSKTLLAIIDDILDLATIDAGALELKLAPVKVRPIIDAAVLGVRERASRVRLNLDIRVDEAVDTFVADEARVRQVLYNLLSNAIGFSKAGDTIRVGCWREASMIAFAVEDQGMGIPREQQARIFDRFESRSHGSRHRGAGLGLSIVKSLVEAHGGNLTLDSEPGRGSRFIVRLPEQITTTLQQPVPARVA
jgi:signal transduction histidine kinase